ncbi:protein FAR1-RELATED SEQUENCE 5-like [Carex rostrata]
MLCIKLDSKIDRWWVTNYVDVHNHSLASSDTTPFLRSHCSINEAEKAEIVTLGSSGIRNCQILDYTERRSGGYEHRGYQLKNLYNFTSMHERAEMLADDADSVIKYFKERTKADTDFFFKYDTEEGHLTSLFWADAQSVLDYSSFGDVVVFDSTYQLNRYKMIVVPFLGINHHWSTIIFACGIVSRENKKSYEWLLEAFMEAMYQVRPEAVITDGDLAMREAIKSVLPGTAHRICTWHMGENAKKYIRDSEVMRMFHKLMSKAYSPEEFENKWQEFDDNVSKREKSRKWLQKIYASKQIWAGAFVKNKMFLGMSTSQRSESLNAKIHKYMNSRLSLCKAVQQLERCVTSMRTKEAELDCRSSQTFPVLTTPFYNLEKSAANNYTRKVFAIVREEIEKSEKFVVIQEPESNTSSTYILAPKGKLESRVNVDCFVSEGNIEKVTCTCYKLECEKIPCSHVFAVLIHLDVTFIPQCCIDERWTKTAKSMFSSDRKGGDFQVSEQVQMCHELTELCKQICYQASKSRAEFVKTKELLKEEQRRLNEIAKGIEKPKVKKDVVSSDKKSPQKIGNPKPVVTKGAPKKKKYERMKSSLEGRRKNKCGHCGMLGHNRQRCQLLQAENDVASNFEKLHELS